MFCILILLFLLINIFILFQEARVVYCVVYFIIFILNMAFLLFIFNLGFFGVLLIIVYVGAVIVLFVFVILMLNVYKEIFTRRHSPFFQCVYFFFTLFSFIFFILIILFNQNFIVLNLLNVFYIDFFFFLNSITSFEILGLVLYTYYFFLLTIITLLLFTSMFGSIALVYTKNPLKVKHHPSKLYLLYYKPIGCIY